MVTHAPAFAARRTLAALLGVLLASSGVWTADPSPKSLADDTPLALRLDPNQASAAELQLLPRIGPALSERIVAYRESVSAPAFRTAGDLEHVRGIGPKTSARLAPHLRFPN